MFYIYINQRVAKNKTQSKKVEESNEYAKKLIGQIDDEIEHNNEMISGRPKMTKKTTYARTN
ncbi:hypothetical protein HGD80_00670 [Paulownia witches'-broom phytoplasma]|uniref:Uncharacterized protein n=1 Tax=Paulownia witches'-broom phytoplasma TaxID=39647 RepID=A0ABX8TPN6_9MOLU|nr:hypothetical protein [Paulownia witches'-broom phytoplasma]QYC31132.1 hypothetical protein HGD80_00670 [Paulownia witches'-broom phytoplasma]GLH60347.1 hypothetical protein PAWBP_0850 [Paulownia witches'-broom phytoplasma]